MGPFEPFHQWIAGKSRTARRAARTGTATMMCRSRLPRPPSMASAGSASSAAAVAATPAREPVSTRAVR